jgi:hypothetical protein
MKQLLGKSPSGLFATQTLTGHVTRGAVAFALLYLAIEQQHSHPVASLLAGFLALTAMRGCPVCWTIGLAETIRRRCGSGSKLRCAAPPLGAGDGLRPRQHSIRWSAGGPPMPERLFATTMRSRLVERTASGKQHSLSIARRR